jgi:uncharacterized protein YozE (UPF0346 family)
MNGRERKGFCRWLATKRDQDNPVGDLARDVLTDEQFPTNAVFLREYLRYFRKSSAYYGAVLALCAAWVEYWQEATSLRDLVRMGKELSVYFKDVGARPEWIVGEDKKFLEEAFNRQFTQLVDGRYIQTPSIPSADQLLRMSNEELVALHTSNELWRNQESPATRSVSLRLRFEVLRRDGFKCRYCGARPPDCVLEVDHVIPHSLGGKCAEENLATACFECNRGKADTPAFLYHNPKTAVQ